MRISTAQFYTQGLKSFGVQQTKLAQLQEKISTGIRISKPSDDPAASARILELEQTQKINEQYQVNINLAENRLNLQESTLTSVNNILQRIRELALQGNNATQDSVSRKSIATEIDELKKELVSLSNTIDTNGDYLFAGHQSKTKPFTENITGSISHIDFNGDQGERYLNISQSRQINTDTNGSDLFMTIPSSTALNETTTITNTGSAVIAPAYVFDNSNYVADTYQITFDTVSSPPDTLYNVVDSGGVIVSSGTYQESGDIEFMGIKTSVTGTPDDTDSFTISAGQNKDVFSIVSELSAHLRLGSSTIETAGSYTFGSDIPVFDYSTDSISFEVDGNLVTLDADYTDISGVTTAIQNQLDLAVGIDNYAVTNMGSSLTISRVATGITSTPPLVNNFDGNVDGNATTLADFTLGGVALNGENASALNDNIAQSILDIDAEFNQVLEARTTIGGRLNALQSQFDDNSAQVLDIQEALSVIRDTDLAEAISQLSLEQTTLDAAQAVFARITSSSLFNYLK